MNDHNGYGGRPTMILQVYRNGKAETVHAHFQGILSEVVMDDGRTVQLFVGQDGRIDLRAWGNIPAKLGYANVVSFHCPLPWEEQTHDPIAYAKLPGPPPDKAAITAAIDALPHESAPAPSLDSNGASESPGEEARHD